MGIFIGSTPNTQNDDILLAKKLLRKEGDINNERFVLEEVLSKIFNTKNLLLLNRGRDALYIGLKALNIKQGDSVLMQAFTCIAVPTPVIWCKAEPKYIDIDPNTFNMDLECLKRSISDKTKVVIIQHTFGNIQNMKLIREIIDKINNKREQKNKIYIIEDCAHLFPSDIEKTNILKYSDIALFSFAQDKCISSTQGGLILFKDENIYKRACIYYESIDEQQEKLSLYNARYILRWEDIKQEYFKPLIKKFPRLTLGKIKIIVYRYFGLIKQQALENLGNPNSIKRFSNIQASLLLNQIKKIEKFNKNRKDITNLYDKHLNEEFKFKKHSEILLRYPVLLSNPGEVLNALSKEKIIGGRWYGTPVFPLSHNQHLVGYINGSCRKAEICGKCIINLPTDTNINSAIAQNIAYIVNKIGRPIKI